MHIITINKYVRSSSKILEKKTAGIILHGPEVKSIKNGNVQLRGAYCTFDAHGNFIVKDMHIAPYAPAKREQQKYKPDRPRILLVSKREYAELQGMAHTKGQTIVPYAIHVQNRIVKLEIAVIKGLKKHDKREIIKKREFERRKKRIVD